MRLNTLVWMSIRLPLLSLTGIAGAHDVCYPQVTSVTITECVPNTGAPKPTPCGAACPNPLVSGGQNSPKGGPITVAVPMPSCQDCGCATCVHANVYTTSFAAFYPEGITTQVYIVKELYTGMPKPPSITQRPEVPMGFVQGVQTCNSCGPQPITSTLIYPADSCPFVGNPSGPAPAPGGMLPWVVSSGGEGGPAYTPAKDGNGWVPAPPPPPMPQGDLYGGQSRAPPGQHGAQTGAHADGIVGAAAGPGSYGGQAKAAAEIQASPGPSEGAAAGVAIPAGAQVGAGRVGGPGSDLAQAAAPAGVNGAAPVAPASSNNSKGTAPDKPSGPTGLGLDQVAGPLAPGLDKPSGLPLGGYQQVSGACVPKFFSALAVGFGIFTIFSL